MPPIKKGRHLLPEGLSHLRHPFRLLVSGKSLSGKTTIVVTMLKFLIPIERWENIILISPTAAQPTWNPIRVYITQEISKSSDEVFERITRRQRVRQDEEPEKTLLLIDDSSAEHSTNQGRKGGLAMLGNTARWMNLSVIIMTQNLTSISPSFRENAEGIIMFQTLKKNEFKYLSDERNPYMGADDETMKRVYRMATMQPYQFYFQINTASGVRNYQGFEALFLLDEHGEIYLQRQSPISVVTKRKGEHGGETREYIKTSDLQEQDNAEEEKPHSYLEIAKSYFPF